MTLLSTKGLAIGYSRKEGQKILQKDVNVAVEAGEIVSLMGQNGVGKTTFIKTISGLIPHLSGEIQYGDLPLAKLSQNALARQMSIVLTERPYSLNISVLELIAIARHPYSGWMGFLTNEDKAAIDRAINDTHIDHLANYKLYELSDGQMQKVMIARALAQETDLIILDEPAAHLDLYNKIEVMVLLRQIAQRGKGILISTHDMQISTQLSDRLWLFNFNEPVIEGAPEDLILSGTLAQTLYLQDYGYDMIHGTLNLSQNGPKIQIDGPEEVVFWTGQAIKRNGFRVVEKADLRVRFEANQWILSHDQERAFDSIRSLLKELKQHTRKAKC